MMRSWLILLLEIGLCHWRIEHVAATGRTIIDSAGVLRSVSADSPYLNLENLEIKEITGGHIFKDYPGLRNLSFADNKLTDLPSGLFSNLHHLKHLNLANNQFKKFQKDCAGLENLKSLNLSHNGISSFRRGDLCALGSFTRIIIDGNHFELLTSDAFSSPGSPAPHNQTSASAPEIGEPGNYQIKLCLSYDKTLKYVAELINKEEPDDCLKVDVKRGSHVVTFSPVRFDKVDKDWFRLSNPSIQTLNFYLTGLKHLTPELLNDLPASVINIDLSYNFIKRIDKNVIDNRAIRTLSLSGNELEAIEKDSFANTELTTLILKYNALTNLDFLKALPSIETLDVAGNELHEISKNILAGVPKLRRLSLNSNFIRNIPADAFEDLGELEELDLSSNRLRAFEPGTFLHQHKLRSLQLEATEFDEWKPDWLTGLRMLDDVNLSYNMLERIHSDTFSALRNGNSVIIRLDNNDIVSIDKGSFADMNIAVLDLHSNRITEKSIASDAFKGSVIGQLDLGKNRMKTINASAFHSISRIDSLLLHKNQIDSIRKSPFRYLKGLSRLDLSNNPLKNLMNGDLYGIEKERGTEILLRNTPITIIESGVFDNL